MQIVKLKISDYCLDLIAQDNLELLLDSVYTSFAREEKEADICIYINKWNADLPSGIQSDFTAKIPLLNGIDLPQRDWQIFKYKNDIYINVYSSFEKEKVETIIQVNDSRNWNLYIHDDLCRENTINPLLHPVGSLLLYYASYLFGDIFLHSSGVFDGSHGRIFSGFSGAGKSTMAKLWKESGAEIIHDDRLILRKREGVWYMHNTPVYLNDYPKSARIDELFIVHHLPENEIHKLTGAKAAAGLFAFCIQHDFDSAVVSDLLNSVADICSSSDVYELGFVPDQSVVQFIKALKIQQ